MGSLKGAVIVVTGGARGIGRAIAEEMARGGAKVVVNYAHSEEAARSLTEQLLRLGAADAVAIHADVSYNEEARQLIDETVRRFGRIDVLVNNAGITVDRSLKKMTAEDWERVIQTDLNAYFYTTSAATPYFVKQEFGRIVNVSSYIGEVGSFGQANYAAAKAGIIGFTKAAAIELARSHVTVNVVAPGYTETDMFAAVPAEVKQKIIDKIPMGRLARPEDVALAVRYLAADADYVTGTVLNVNGGLPCSY